MIAWMRVTYLAVVDIPNNERSFYVSGFEFHHVYMGFVGLLILEHWAIPKSNRGMVALAIIHGIATGWIFGQALFFAMSDMTDAWYQHPLSLFGGVGTFAVAVLLTLGIMVRPKMSAMHPRNVP